MSFFFSSSFSFINGESAALLVTFLLSNLSQPIGISSPLLPEEENNSCSSFLDSEKSHDVRSSTNIPSLARIWREANRRCWLKHRLEREREHGSLEREEEKRCSFAYSSNCRVCTRTDVKIHVFFM